MMWARGMLYKGVSQTLLLYGSNDWVVTVAMMKFLEGFHNWADQLITGMVDWRMEYREW